MIYDFIKLIKFKLYSKTTTIQSIIKLFYTILLIYIRVVRNNK